LDDIYHPPVGREYYHEESAYLGTIFLWRERVRAPISEPTLVLLDRLEGFIMFMMSDAVTRHHYSKPLDRVFFEVIRDISARYGLAMQERRVLVLRLMGLSYKSIGVKLCIATNTVGKHVTSIYRKTGTGSTAELFAKFFSPLISEEISLASNR
jgi:DNA-binding CsgD family transcriptional regulator